MKPGLQQSEASARFAAVLERIAGLEDQLVIVMSGCEYDDQFHEVNPHSRAAIDEFNLALGAEAARHGFV